MDVSDIIDMTRKMILMDYTPPYLWEDDELIYCLNRAMSEIYRIPVRRDQTSTLREIHLLSNLGVYAVNSAIQKIDSARLESDGRQLDRETETRLDATHTDWRSDTGTPTLYCPNAYTGYLSIYPKYDDTGEIASTYTFAVAGSTITKIGGTSFLTDLAVGDEIQIVGSVSNTGVLTIVTIADANTMTVSETLVAEVSVVATLRLVRDSILMTVSRFSVDRFVVSDIENATEITDLTDEQAEGLPDGIAKRAFLKPNSQTLDPNKAEQHRQLFEVFKREIKRDLILLHKPDKSRVPRSGTSIWY